MIPKDAIKWMGRLMANHIDQHHVKQLKIAEELQRVKDMPTQDDNGRLYEVDDYSICQTCFVPIHPAAKYNNLIDCINCDAVVSCGRPCCMQKGDVINRCGKCQRALCRLACTHNAHKLSRCQLCGLRSLCHDCSIGDDDLECNTCVSKHRKKRRYLHEDIE